MLTILRDVMDELVPVRRGNVPRSAALRNADARQRHRAGVAGGGVRRVLRSQR